jgi:hypothetical protein
MNTAIAIRTLDALATGTDPVSGAVLPDASPYNQPQVLRALYLALKVLQTPRQFAEPQSITQSAVQPVNESSAAQSAVKPAAQSAVLQVAAADVQQSDASGKKRKTPRLPPANAGKAWSDEEDKQLCAEFDSGLAVKEIAVKHSRSAAALNARLFKLGKIADPGFPLRGRQAAA